MVTTVTNNSPQAINTSLFSLQKEIDDLRRQINQMKTKDTAAESELAKGLVPGGEAGQVYTSNGSDSPSWQDVKGEKGDKGDQGPQGPQGPKGDKGDMPDVSALIDDSKTDSAHTWSSEKIENRLTSKKGEVGVPQVVHFNTSSSAGSYELVRFGYRSAFRCVISGTCPDYAEAKIIDVTASNASVPQSNNLGNIAIGPQGNFSFGGGDWAASFMYWNKPLTKENVYYTVVFIPYSENNVDLVI